MISKKDFEKILDDNELLSLQMFSDNPLQLEAVKKIILYQLRTVGVEEKTNPVVVDNNSAYEFLSHFPNASNDEVANNLRAKWEAWRIILNAFDNFAVFKEEKRSQPEKENPAV